MLVEPLMLSLKVNMRLLIYQPLRISVQEITD